MTQIYSQFKHQRVTVNGNIQIHYRIGGSGEPLFLLHGWPQHSLMWHMIAPILAGVSKGSGMHGSKKNGSRTIDPVPEPKNYHAPTIAIANRASP